MTYYGYILLLSFLGPLCLSFDRKVAYYRTIPQLFLPLLLVSGLFLVWDHWFTSLGVWGFNKAYVSSVFLGRLPLEEVLFFVVVPYNCLFIYQVVGAYFKPSSNRRFNGWFMFLFALLGGFLYIKNPTGWYTLTAVSFALFLMLILLYYNPTWTTHFIIAFLVCLLPFLVVNGLLTGVATPEPVVWYNQQSFSGWRMATIPVEDLFYNFDLFLGFVVLFNAQTKKKSAAFR